MTNEEFQALIISELKKINQRFDSVDSRFDTIETKIDQIESQQRENTDFIQALLHQSEELSAKYDGLLNITVSKENFLKLEKKIDTLAYRIIEQDNDISVLRRAK